MGEQSAIAKLSQQYGLEEAKLLDTLKATVIRPKKIRGKDGKPDTYQAASTEEVNAFLMVAARYDLDPMLKQIHAFVADGGGGIVPIVGYDGWIKLVNKERRFAGFRSEDITDGAGNLVATKGTMKVWVDAPGGDFYEVSVTEYLEECKRDTEPWKKWPRRMLRNKVYIQTARMAFGLSGLYDEDEGQRILEAKEAEAIDITPTKVPKALPKSPSSTTSGASGTEKEPPPAAQDGSGSTGGGGSPSPASEGGDRATGAEGASGAGAPAEAPKSDPEKKEYITKIAERAAKEYNVPVSQVLWDLSKFPDKNDATKEVGIQAIDDPRLMGRWLNKVYGEAKKLEGVLDGKGPF